MVYLQLSHNFAVVARYKMVIIMCHKYSMKNVDDKLEAVESKGAIMEAIEVIK